jgi:hypothetical protein
MEYDDFKEYILNPDLLNNSSEKDWLELTEKYPYFRLAKWIYLKYLYETNSIYFGRELKMTALQANNRRNLYFFIFPEKTNNNEHAFFREENSGSYFDLLNKLEKKDDDKPNSLKTLAEKLKNARKMIQEDVINDSESQKVGNSENIIAKSNEYINTKNTESQVKFLVQEKKYKEAIELLEELNLINPKKSVYFADLIRFLKKITDSQF